MGRTLQKAKGRRASGAFLAIPFDVINSDNFKKLSARAVKLLIDVSSQIRIKQGGPVNNGDLCITAKVNKERGWNSRDSLYTAKNELLHYGFISITRIGGRNLPHLYALTFFAINECHGKLDVSETRVPSNDWKQAKKKWRRSTRKQTRKNKPELNSLYRFSAPVVPINGTTTLNYECYYNEKLPSTNNTDFF